jgi:aldose 1-epimerase
MADGPTQKRHGRSDGEVHLTRRTSDGENRAVINLRGGGLRVLTIDGSSVVEPYAVGHQPPHCAGAVLFPWPNRVRDGRWSQRSVEHQLPVNQPELDNALHGLVQEAAFDVASVASDEVTVSTAVPPQPGYPFAVTLTITYRLTANGLEIDNTVTNSSDWPAPVSLGAHPYLRLGDLPTDDLTVRIDATTYFTLDQQLIPTAQLHVSGSGFDLRTGLPIAGADLNHCYGQLNTVDGRSHHLLRAPDGRTLELWADQDFAYVQVYICPDFPRRDVGGEVCSTGRAIAIEPMTAPPDALNSGLGLRWLEPGEIWETSWGIILSPRSSTPM